MPPPLTGEPHTLSPDDSLVSERITLPRDTVLAGRYRIRELIGEGGMGDVYLAEHLKIDKEVAVKVLAPQQMRRPRTVSRFLQEAKAASKIRHANIVDITDYGESDGSAFFVMEYLRGEDLSFLVKREGRLPWSRTKPIVTQLLEALGAAHAAGIVHRDIKPHNCFVTPQPDGSDLVKVIDFGIAKVSDGSDEQLTQTGAIMGTAEYMSPEQGLGETLDGRSDLYSVGVILYRMLTGALPCQGNNPMAILYQHIHAERIPPSEACPKAGIGPEVDALVLRALARERDQRFESADAFIAALRVIDDIGDGTGPPPSARRRVPWLPLAGLVALSALGIAAFVGRGDPSVAEPESMLAAATTPPEPQPQPQPQPVAAAFVGESDTATEPPDSPPTTAPPIADTPPDESEAPAPPGEPEPAAAKESSPPPTRRSTRELRSRLGRISAKVRACGKQAGLFPGESVSVRLKINPKGRVSSAKVMGAFSRRGAACIETAVRGVRFSAARLPQAAEHRFTL